MGGLPYFFYGFTYFHNGALHVGKTFSNVLHAGNRYVTLCIYGVRLVLCYTCLAEHDTTHALF